MYWQHSLLPLSTALSIVHCVYTGAVRVSFGYMSTFSDVHAVIRSALFSLTSCLPPKYDLLQDCSSSWQASYDLPVQGTENLPVLCRFVEQYFVEGLSPHQQAAAGSEKCTAQNFPIDSMLHHLKPEAAHRLAQDSIAEATRSGGVLSSQPSTPLSTEHSGSDADDAVLDQSHHRHVNGNAASLGTSSEEGGPSVAADTGAGAAAISEPGRGAAAQLEGPVRLERIWVYPIKSCAGFAPSSWPLGLNGLLYDRYGPGSWHPCPSSVSGLVALAMVRQELETCT